MGSIHYTLFFDASTTATPDAKGRFRYAGLHVGDRASTSLNDPPPPAGTSFVGPIPAGTKMFVSLVETSGTLQGVARCSFVDVPAQALLTFQGPFAAGLPGLAVPGVVTMTPVGGGLAGTLNPDGFDLQTPPEGDFASWPFNIVVFAGIPGALQPRIFVLDRPTQMAFKRSADLPDIGGTSPASEGDSTGVPIP